ncbi:MAG: hypothetical protein PHX93_03515 [Candidatus Peribacteraceae bacterium]|nr:hypothetical protein [Candidatus Peribacteraceae bacterium]
MDPQQLHELRQELSRINQLPRDEQEEAVEDLRQQYNHTVELAELGPDDVADDFPAFAHCFDLHKNPIILKNKEKIFSNHGFRNDGRYKWGWSWRSFYPVAYHFMKKVAEKDIQENDVVAYLAELTDDIREMTVIHMGKIRMGKIISKWGRGQAGSSTNIWCHDALHVPDTYENKAEGISVAYFRPNRKEITDYFLRGCRE